MGNTIGGGLLVWFRSAPDLIKRNKSMFEYMSKIQVFVFAIFAILAAMAICYYAEHDRTILLLGVYPACAFGALGFVAWMEAE